MNESTKKDIKKVVGFTRCGLIGGLLMPFLGWALTGWGDLEFFFKNETEKALVWVVVGIIVGNIIQVVIEKLNLIEGRKGAHDDENSRK